MPIELLIEKLKESIDEWYINPSDDNMKRIEMSCHLMALRQITKDKSVEQVIEDMEESNRITSAFNNLKFQS